MVLNIFFSPVEIRQFFQFNGFQVIEKEFGRWDKVSHLNSKYVSWMEDVVVYENDTVKAADLFKRLCEIRLKDMLAPVGPDVRQRIENQFKQLSNKH